jgi:hypothetical protein
MEYLSSSPSLLLEEYSFINRINEPVTVGVPFPQGVVFDPATLTLRNSQGEPAPVQAQLLARWSDNSLKWALLDFQANVEAGKKVIYQLGCAPAPDGSLFSSLVVRQSPNTMVVDTGRAQFFLDRRIWKPFARVVIQGKDFLEDEGSRLLFIDTSGQAYTPAISCCSLETVGPLRATVKAEGELPARESKDRVRFIARLSFYAGSSLVEIKLTLHNPQAARHPGGLWDLGDAGSVYFQDLSLCLPLQFQNSRKIAWTTYPTATSKELWTDRFEIYQDSSGGENWQSSNHINRFGEVKHTFRGYRATSDGQRLEEGLRATPVLTVSDGEKSVTAAIAQFWQNFPKALEAQNNQLILRLFPQQYADLFELQGGEQKTHTLYVQFDDEKTSPERLYWVHDRLLPRATPEWYANAKACSYLSPHGSDQQGNCRSLIDAVISGPQSFFARREIIDEYGWRNFGDVYADHEAVGHAGATPLVAHYNNQYDVVYGVLVQYLRSGDRRWFELARDLARHVIDIDIYHTEEDRLSYNGGLFWHTDHSCDAATATHRAYSKINQEKNSFQVYGGGPSNEHNYTTGLLLYYFLTGDVVAKETVQRLADWVINMDDGSRRPFGFFDRRPTGISSATAKRDYYGPGRGAGNSINALLDGYGLTGEAWYLARAEQLIRRCIHPRDNIQARRFEDIEHRWSYIVFLQVLGKYLDLKAARGECDFMYGYAQASLLHYAKWMLEHEAPYTEVLDRVAIPSETWPAQDIRKCCVFNLAAKHAAEPLRNAFKRKADFFSQACIADLRSWKTCTLTRPLVLLMTNAHVHAYFQHHLDESAPRPTQQYDFGAPQRFSPQFAELYWARRKLHGAAAVLKNTKRFLRNMIRKKPYRLEELRG